MVQNNVIFNFSFNVKKRYSDCQTKVVTLIGTLVLLWALFPSTLDRLDVPTRSIRL